MEKTDELKELFGINSFKDWILSYSTVSAFYSKGPGQLIKRSDVKTQAFKIGSYVDDLLMDFKNIKNKYYVFDGEKPTASLGKLCDIILINYLKIPTKDEIYEITITNNLWSRSKKETVISNFDKDEFWDYLNAMFEAKNKTLLTTSDKILGEELANILKTHPYSKFYFDNGVENYEIKYQEKARFKIKGLNFKGILDIIHINHEKKEVKFIDLKTGSDNALDFRNSFIKWKYYLQEAVYTNYFRTFCKKYNLKGYKLLPFEFLYISKFEKIPVVYKVPTKWHKAAKQGFILNGWKYKGLNELINEIKWHIDTNEFKLDKEVHNQNGKLILDDSIITISNEKK